MRGMAMGISDAVPGVSGGTIAVITGIYEQLLLSIRRCDFLLLKLLFKRHWTQAWNHIQGQFVITLGIGVGAGLLVSANTVLYLLEAYPEPLLGFFCGLVFSSALLLQGRTDKSSWYCWLAAGFGVVIVSLIAQAGTAALPVTPINLFLAGAIAISAMILPGLSGAFILLLLGMYEPVLRALVELRWIEIALFASGCGLGLLLFSRFLYWMLQQYGKQTYGFVLGLLFGSLQILWPWQIARDPATPELTDPVMPWSPAMVTPSLFLTLVAAGSGVIIVIFLYRQSQHPSLHKKGEGDD